jgi:hypothetical protein
MEGWSDYELITGHKPGCAMPALVYSPQMHGFDSPHNTQQSVVRGQRSDKTHRV